MTEPESRAIPKSVPVREEVVRLVREKRYEEALAVLYRARAESPGDRELQTSIERIKEFLAGAYAKRLGGLDQVAGPIPVAAGRSPDALMVARYIDGSSTFDDIVQMCPLGKLRTLQVLVGLYTGREVASPFSEATPPSWRRAPSPSSPDLASDAGPPTMPTRGLEQRAPEPPPASAPFTLRVVETEEDRRYREAFSRGTAAFVQRRFAEAVEAFEACVKMRPGDNSAAVMLRRAQRDRDLDLGG
ncbi:TRP-like protein [Sorangium cellulosum]|uniref:TRP-like protein n=1 Tax=Sorangium cellulosum TaxID=56 RepID=A0A150PL30_SORCE|nr:TRP-like protein [Sorangium cellulosum]